MANDLAARYAQQVGGIKTGNSGATGGFATAAVSGKPIPAKTEFVAPKAPSLPGIVQKGVDVTKQIANATGTVAQAVGRFAVNTPKYVANDMKPFATGIARTLPGGQNDIKQQQAYQRALDASLLQVQKSYKAGKMSKENYQKALQGLSQSYADVSKETAQLLASTDRGNVLTSAAMTAGDILSAGRLSGTKVASNSLVGQAANGVGKFIDKVPAGKALLERNAAAVVARDAQKLAGETAQQWLARAGKDIGVGLLIKRPIFYQQNIEGGEKVYKEIMNGNYPEALKTSAWLGTQMLRGGPVGAFFSGAAKLKTGLATASYGKHSFIDEISKQIGNKNPSQIARFLTTIQKKSPKEFEEANKVFKILQETNLQTTNDDVNRAVDNVLTHYTQHNIPLENLTPSQIYKDFSNWAKADELAQKTLRSGLVKDVRPEEAQKYVVVRWDTPTKNAVADTLEKAGEGAQAQLDAINEIADRPGVGWGNNEILRNKIYSIIGGQGTAKEKADAIRNISTASMILSDVPKTVSKELADLGYSIAAPAGYRRVAPVEGDLRNLVTGAIKGDKDVFDVTQAPDPTLSGIAGALDKMGLSPRSENQVANRKLSESVVANLDELGMGSELGLKNTQGGDVVMGGQAILSKLQQYVENKRPALGLGQKSAITDIRQLTHGEVKEALGVTSAQAKQISQAVMKGYLDVPLEFRGLGDKVIDGLYTYNPLHKYYSRIQSAFRYTYNPFFRVQERVETKLLSHAQANNLVWGKSKSTLDSAAKQLDDSGIFTSSLSGEAAQDQVLGRITANITQGQKRDLAGLALDMAKSRGVDLQTMVNEHGDELDDALRVVVQYPKHGVLASSLARTLNVAFFPIRYNAKVTMLAGKVLAKQPPSVQVAALHTIFTMKDWLKSDEGIRWQSQHADAIQLLQWLTPINSIQSTMNLLGHKPNSIGDLGSLGGLPLGVISQVLDGQGIINLNTPYVSPKTGDVFPDYIPETAKARAATALTDILGTTFTYPGRTLGLPGKEATMKKVVKAFIDTNGTDFDKRIDTEKLTPLQKQWIKVLKGDTSKEAIDALYNSPAPGQFQGPTLPPLSLPYKVVPPTTQAEFTKRRGLPSGKKAKKEKNLAVPITAQPISNSLNTPE
ncbi:hypothetical protein EPO05_06420 [Patescibacteria group bacterium]|nr:MAG: hypothetical protein EPO05_06420 [Patescibacteria group bacterium]